MARAAPMLLLLVTALQLSQLAFASCPHMLKKGRGLAQSSAVPRSSAEGVEDPVLHRRRTRQLQQNAAIDYDALKQDIAVMLVTNQDFWPQDPWGTYGPFMVRLAWHCSGSYRISDGRGGCDGALIRFDPMASWPDNQNLNMALALLQPLKDKYGDAISWGDLIIFTGTTAIEILGGPSLGFCGGRIDYSDGTDALPLGPSDYQQEIAPCAVNGQCTAPLGPTTVGLIYVNPEGPMGNPDPFASALEVRDVFARMGMNDSETVALIGGGHVLGKMHGACPLGPGLCTGYGPVQGKGLNTYTSGFEGTWGFAINHWSNEYFDHLRSHLWEVFVGPGGKYQWRPTPETASYILPQFANFGLLEHFMLTSDMALLYDMTYNPWVQLYGSNESALIEAFTAAWYKLTTRDMGPVSRCTGPLTMTPQPFQYPLPPTPALLADFASIKLVIKQALRTWNSALLPDMVGSAGNSPYYGALFATLAWRCASTFRSTDYQGGCNGARIRLSPQKDWPVNVGMDLVLSVLAPIQAQYDQSSYGGPALSWADLIVLAGQAAIEDASGQTLQFCGGRVDSNDGGPDFLAPRSYADPVVAFKDNADVLGVTLQEAVALAAMPRSATQMQWLGYALPASSWVPATNSDASKLTNAYFKTLINNQWDPVATSPMFYMSRSGGLAMTANDIAIIQDPTLLKLATQFATDNSLFLSVFTSAWTQVMNADRFAGPTANLCG